jgi:hypothetical protein
MKDQKNSNVISSKGTFKKQNGDSFEILGDSEISIIFEKNDYNIIIFLEHKKENKKFNLKDVSNLNLINSSFSWVNNNITYIFEFKNMNDDMFFDNLYKFIILNNSKEYYKNYKIKPFKNDCDIEISEFLIKNIKHGEIIFSEKGNLYIPNFENNLDEKMKNKDFIIYKYNNQFYFYIGDDIQLNLIFLCKDVEYELIKNHNCIIIVDYNDVFYFIFRKPPNNFHKLVEYLEKEKIYTIWDHDLQMMKINIKPLIFDPINEINISKNRENIILTCDKYIILVKVQKNQYVIDLKKKVVEGEKKAIILEISQTDINNKKLEKEKFKNSEFTNDNKISTTIGKFNIKWSLENIYNSNYKYEISELTDNSSDISIFLNNF